MRTLEDLKNESFVDDETGCWIFRGAKSQSGQPSFWISEINHVGSVGTFLSLITTGERPKKGQCWVARCKNKLCVRPDDEHRVLGTFRDAQRLSRPSLPALHRVRIAKTRHANSERINLDIAREIRQSDETGKAWAARLGVSPSLISCIRLHKVWRDNCAGGVFNWRP